MRMTRQQRRRILIAAVAVVGILFVGWMWNRRPERLAHRLRLGQTEEEVVAIMGSSAFPIANVFCYGWTVSRIVDVAYRFVARPPEDFFLPQRYSVLVWFDDNGRVSSVICPREGIDLR
jgi:hypothetical protein